MRPLHKHCKSLRFVFLLQGARRLVEPILPGNVTMSSVHLASQPARASTASATEGNAAATGLTRALGTARSRGGSSLDGSGTLVCVIDTGINFQNELYGSCTGVNAPKGQCRVVTGFNFVGDGYNGRLDGPAAVRGGLPVSSKATTQQHLVAAAARIQQQARCNAVTCSGGCVRCGWLSNTTMNNQNQRQAATAS
jgi:hypothetical protein